MLEERLECSFVDGVTHDLGQLLSLIKEIRGAAPTLDGRR
jgi:hypothetical protein